MRYVVIFVDGTGPPKETPPVPLDRGQELWSSREYGTAAACARREYWRLLVERLSENLPTQFVCSACGVIAIDPAGWNGPKRPLCERCADHEGTV